MYHIVDIEKFQLTSSQYIWVVSCCREPGDELGCKSDQNKRQKHASIMVYPAIKLRYERRCSIIIIWHGNDTVVNGTPSVADTGGKLSTSVVDTSGKFTTRVTVICLDHKKPLSKMTPVVNLTLLSTTPLVSLHRLTPLMHLDLTIFTNFKNI